MSIQELHGKIKDIKKGDRFWLGDHLVEVRHTPELDVRSMTIKLYLQNGSGGDMGVMTVPGDLTIKIEREMPDIRAFEMFNLNEWLSFEDTVSPKNSIGSATWTSEQSDKLLIHVTDEKLIQKIHDDQVLYGVLGTRGKRR